jgi:4-hydroxybenzoyl-CoA thioesterase
MAVPSQLFVQVRRVPWGDADPAGSVYLANVSRYCMEAVEQWFLDRLGIDWYQLTVDRRIGTPFVHAELQFSSPATPRDILNVTVAVEKVGRSSVLFRVIGSVQGGAGRCCWEGRFTCVFIDATTLRPISIPEEFRASLEHDIAPAVTR